MRLVSQLRPTQSTRRTLRSLSLLAILIVLAFAQSGLKAFSFSGGPSVLTSVFIPGPTGDTLVPAAIATAANGGTIVAGQVDVFGRPWAAAIGANQRLQWNYVRKDNLPPVAPGRLSSGGYAGVVPMPDGTTYLCGTAPGDIRLPTMGILTHLGKDGSVLSELSLSVEGQDRDRSFDVRTCGSYRGGIVVAGGSERSVKAVYVRGDQIVWKVEIDGYPPMFTTVAQAQRASVSDNGESVTVLMTNNRSTTIVDLGERGAVLHRSMIDGGYLLVRPGGESRSMQIFGPTPAIISRNREIRDLERDGSSTVVAEGASVSDFEPSGVAKLTDGNLVFFGSSIHKFGRNIRSALAVTAPNLQRSNSVDLEDNTENDGGKIQAFAYVRGGEFAVARLQAYPGRCGAIVDFVRFN